MKKAFLFLFALVLLFLLATYIFIPSTIIVSGAAKIGTSENGAARYLLEEKNWPKWWNAKDSGSIAFSQSKNDFIVNSDTFNISKLQHMSAEIGVRQQGLTLQSRLLLVSFSVDTTGV